jgi:hypothetical protein
MLEQKTTQNKFAGKMVLPDKLEPHTAKRFVKCEGSISGGTIDKTLVMKRGVSKSHDVRGIFCVMKNLDLLEHILRIRIIEPTIASEDNF